MSRTIRKTHYRNGKQNNAWLRCKLPKKLRTGQHTPKNCWGCW